LICWFSEETLFIRKHREQCNKFVKQQTAYPVT